MNQIIAYAEKAGALVGHNTKVINYLNGISTKFPIKPIQGILEFCKQGILADVSKYPQLGEAFSIPMGNEEGIRQAFGADKNALMSELSSAIYSEFDQELVRPEYWVASYYILKRQREYNPELCDQITTVFRSVYHDNGVTDRRLEDWLHPMICEITATSM